MKGTAAAAAGASTETLPSEASVTGDSGLVGNDADSSQHGGEDDQPGAPAVPRSPVVDPAEHEDHVEQGIPLSIKSVLAEPIDPTTTADPAVEQEDTWREVPELAQVAATLTSLEERLRESQRLLARQSDLAAKLHAENQRLRAGELRAATLPLVRDLVRLHDDIGKLTAGQEDTQDLDLVKISLLDALARNGITTFQPAPGEQFDSKQHSVAGILQTDDASLDRTVAEVIRTGVRWEDGQTIRVADVRVHKHTPAAESTSPAG